MLTTAPVSSTKRILIADRDAPIASLLKSAVCRVVDCEVTVAHNAAAAADALRATDFDLVLLDVGMYSEGLETLNHVRGRNASCEVIALTTGIIGGAQLKALSTADVFAIVAKPFDVAQLSEVVIESLRSDRAATPNEPLVYRDPGADPTRS